MMKYCYLHFDLLAGGTTFQIDNLFKLIVSMKPFCKYCTCFSVCCKNRPRAAVCESFSCKYINSRCNSALQPGFPRGKRLTVVMTLKCPHTSHLCLTWRFKVFAYSVVSYCKCNHSLTAELHAVQSDKSYWRPCTPLSTLNSFT